MKTVITILTALFISLLGLAAKQAPLPEEPWRAIVHMEKWKPEVHWEGDVAVKLLGSYTSEDSTMVEQSIAQLNTYCETVKLYLTNEDRGGLEVFFIDSVNQKVYSDIFRYDNDKTKWFYNTNRAQRITHFNLALQFDIVPGGVHQNFLTSYLAFALYPKYLMPDYVTKKGREVDEMPRSVFVSQTRTARDDIFYAELSIFDIELITAVYSLDFAEQLVLAKKQYYLHPSWVNKNHNAILVFPLLLALLLGTGFILLVYKRRLVNINNKLWRFNATSMLSLLLLIGLVALYIIMSDRLRHYANSFFQVYDVIGGMLIGFIIGLVALNVFSLTERLISRYVQHKFLKVLLLFVTTSLIPPIAFLLLTFATVEEMDVYEVKIVVYFLVVCSIIGILRSLISFFMLNEKELIVANEVKLSHLREMKTKAELSALHSKINPHFLYNSLNSIAGLAHVDASKTEQMALSLSKLFRYSINKTQSDWTTFAEEMEMVNIYLDIEKIRFDDRLSFAIDLPQELKDISIPRFIIQPLVENAIKHGVSHCVANGIISITIRRNAHWVEVVVADNGAAFPDHLMPGFGLQSIYDKLEILYPEKFELHFVNTPEKYILIKLAY